MIIQCKVCNKEFYLRPAIYKRGRRCCSVACSDKIRKIPKGKYHPNWKGKNASYGSIHTQMRRIKEKTGKCECCGKKTDFLDLANISQKYKRIISDWEYLCRKCHMTKDGRIKTFRLNVKPKARIGKMFNCFVCGKETYRKPSEELAYQHQFCSRKCAGKHMANKRWGVQLIG